MATKTYYEPKEEAVPWLVGIDMQNSFADMEQTL